MGLFEKGGEGGPGRHPIPPEIKAARLLNKRRFALVLQEVFDATKEELKLIVNDKENPMLKRTVASILIYAYEEGDYKRLAFLLDYAIGKPVEQLKVERPIPTVIELLEGGSVILGAEYKQEAE